MMRARGTKRWDPTSHKKTRKRIRTACIYSILCSCRDSDFFFKKETLQKRNLLDWLLQVSKTWWGKHASIVQPVKFAKKNLHATSATTNAAWQCSSSGTRYAKVFPLPVGATPMMSRPLIAAGHTWQRLGQANGRGKCRIVSWDPTWRFWKQKEWSQVTSQSTWRTYSGKQLKVAKDSLSLDAFLPLIPEESASRCQGGLRFGQKAST